MMVPFRAMRIKNTLWHRVCCSVLFAVVCFQARAQTELIVNGGFESGSAPWVFAGGSGAYSDGYSYEGVGYAWFGGAVNEVDSGYQTITIPNTASNATLSFYYSITSAEGTASVADTFTATIRNT